jgi:hypothetical protein
MTTGLPLQRSGTAADPVHASGLLATSCGSQTLPGSALNAYESGRIVTVRVCSWTPAVQPTAM